MIERIKAKDSFLLLLWGNDEEKEPVEEKIEKARLLAKEFNGYLAAMDKFYNRQLKAPAYASSAITGEGVNDTLKACMVLTLRSLKKQAGWG